jgi:hypothetical protein
MLFTPSDAPYGLQHPQQIHYMVETESRRETLSTSSHVLGLPTPADASKHQPGGAVPPNGGDGEFECIRV